MAISLVAGLTSVAGAMATAGTLAIGFSTAMTYFAVGAGLSMVSRALMPKPDMGTRLGGIEQTVKKPAMARQLIYGRAKVGGNIVYFDNTGANNRYLHMVIAIAGHEIDAYEKVYFNDEVVWDGSYQGDWADYARIKFYKGDQTSADIDLVSESSGWNNNCKLLDTAYLYVRLDYDQEKFADGVPNISCLVRGKKVLDPRTSTTAWSDNPALCIYDYLRDQKYGLNTSDILVSTVIASANDCETQVDYDDNGTTLQHDKYKLNGVIDTSQKISTNIENMLTAMAGRVVFSGGNFEVHSGKYSTPTVTLDESMVVGDIQFSTKTSRRSTYNGVKGMFLSEELNYTLADYPAQISSTYQTEDGEPLYLDMTLPFTVDNVRAQRLAKLALLKSRQQRTLIMPVSLAGLKLKAGDTVYINNTRLGLSNAPYEVLDYELSYGENLTVNLSLIETASEYYDWNVSDQIDFSVSTDVALYNGTPVAPSNLSLTAGTNLKADGTATGYIDASWTASADAFVDHYIVEYSNGSDKQSIKSNDTAHRITTFNDNQTYTVNVYAVNLINRKSSALSGTVTSVIDTTAPEDITSISISGGLQTIDLSWTNPSDDDFDLVRIKVADTNVEPASHSFEVRADNFTHDIGAYSTTKHYWLAPVDRTGNVGNYVSAGSATTGSIAIGDIPHVAGTFYLTLADNDAPTDAEFSGAVGRNPIEGDVAVVNKAYFFTRGASAWSEVAEFIDGSLLVSGSVNADRIEVDGTSASVTIDGNTGTPILVQSDGSTVFSVSNAGNVTMNGAYITGIPVTAIPTFEADVKAVVGTVAVDAVVPSTLVEYDETDFPTNPISWLKIIDTGQTAYDSEYSFNLVFRVDDSWYYEYSGEEDKKGSQDLYYYIEGYNSVTTQWDTILSEVQYDTPVFYKLPRGGNPQEVYVIDITESLTSIPQYYTGFRVWFRGVVASEAQFGRFAFTPYMTVKSGSSGFIPQDISVTTGTASGGGSLTYDNEGGFTFNPANVPSLAGYATETYVTTAISNLVDSAPTTLDTLNELANALGDDPNFATTVTNSIATKASKAGDTFTGTVISTKSTIGSIGGNADMTNAGFLAGSTSNGIGIDGNEIVKVGGDKFFINQIGDNPIEFHLGVSATNSKKLSITTGGIEVSGTISATGYNASNWDTAYGWGDHSTQNYAVTTGDTFTGLITLSADSGLHQYTENGAYINWDTRDSSLGGSATAMVHKWARKADDSGYATYYENWYDGNSYHSIGVNGDRWKLSDGLDINGTITATDATLSGGDLRIYNDASNYGRILFGESATDGNVIIEYDGTGSGDTNYLNFYSDVSGWMTKGSSLNIQPSTGNVAVGSNTYTDKFNVTGTIRADSYKVGTTEVIDSSRNLTNVNTITQTGASGNSLYAISLTRGGTQIWSSQPYLRLGTSSSREDLNITDTATSINVMNGYQTEGAIHIGRSDGTARYHTIYAYNDGTAGNNYLKFNVHNGSVSSTTNALTLWGDGQAEISGLKISSVGGIKQVEGEFGIGSGGIGLHFNNSGSNILPYSYTSNAWTNGTANLGHPSYKFKDFHLSGTVYSTNGYRIGSTLVIDSSSNATFAGGTYNGQLVVDGGVGVNSSGTFHLRQKGDTVNDGMAITSSFNTAHRIWKDASGVLNFGISSTPNQFGMDTSGNFKVGGSTVIDASKNITSGSSIRTTNTASGHSKIELGVRGGGGNATGRTVLIEGTAEPANGEGNGRILFTEHNSTTTQADNYGVSFGYTGNISTTFPSGVTPAKNLNGYWYMAGHNNSATGSAFMYGFRDGAKVFFDSNLELTATHSLTVGGSTVIDSARNAEFATIETTGTNRFSGDYTYFGTTTSNRAEIIINTFNAGSPQITFTDNQGDMTWSIGCDDADNHFKLHGNYSSSIPIINNLSTPQFEWQNSGNFIAQGNITAYSDERLKGNIEIIENALDKVSSLKGVTFDKIHEEDDIRHTGVIAQDVEKVLPEAVITHGTGYKSVAYGNMVGLLIEAIKELKSEIEELKNANSD